MIFSDVDLVHDVEDDMVQDLCRDGREAEPIGKEGKPWEEPCYVEASMERSRKRRGLC